MIRMRPVEKKDLEALLSFAKEAGVGFTTLPRDKKLIEEKIAASEASFAASLDKPFHESYLFVLENEGIVMGCSALMSRIGMSEPFYAYHLLSEHQESAALAINREIKVLHFMKARKKPTEICTLFLKKEHRQKHLGKFLSLSRFLFIADYPERFAPVVITELRGEVTNEGVSPFYEAIGRPFFNLTFDEAIHLRTQHPACITEIFPHHPLYTLLLPKEAEQCIGKLHVDTLAAKKILEKQGFSVSPYVDILDAGPHLFAQTSEIHAVKESQTATVTGAQAIEGASVFISTTTLPWRATLSPLLSLGEQKVALPQEALDALEIEKGAKIRFYTGSGSKFGL